MSEGQYTGIKNSLPFGEAFRDNLPRIALVSFGGMVLFIVLSMIIGR